MKIPPPGKTAVQITSDVHQSDLKAGDRGYIDGYMQAVDGSPYVVFVREKDGLIDLALINQVKAVSN